jgi:hypothetical protein
MFLNLRKLLFLGIFVVLFLGVKAQLELAHFSTKDFVDYGIGGSLNVGIQVTHADFITAEWGLFSFGAGDNNVIIAPATVGFRHTLDGSGARWYAEPNVGYALGRSRNAKLDPSGNPIRDSAGNYIYPKSAGPSAGLTFGYIFTDFPINIGLHYERTFAAPDPGINLFSLRASFVLNIGHRYR